MSFESLLNTLWVCIAITALSVLVFSELRRCRRTSRAARWSRLLSVVFAIVFLFPCVSCSDDLLSLQNWQLTSEPGGALRTSIPGSSNDEKPALYLQQFFEGLLQNFEVAALHSILLSLWFFAPVVIPHRLACERDLLSTSGCDPPAPAVS